MAENSNIEWTHHTFNPWIGCQKVGPGCDHCYAETFDNRFNGNRWGPHAIRTRTSPANWKKPLAWDRAAAKAGERHRVFCASLADVFDNHASVLPEWRADLWALIRATPNLDWMLLTKRPSNISAMLPDDWGAGYANVWLGCTVVNQTEADRDIQKLLSVPARVRFLSMEPLLGAVDLTRLQPVIFDATANALKGVWRWKGGPMRKETEAIDLVIVGGESGPNARPMHPDWARSLRDQCRTAGVAFHFKQWGEWGPLRPPVPGDLLDARKERIKASNGAETSGLMAYGPDPWVMRRVGKKAAGRELDGRTWDEMPEVIHD